MGIKLNRFGLPRRGRAAPFPGLPRQGLTPWPLVAGNGGDYTKSWLKLPVAFRVFALAAPAKRGDPPIPARTAKGKAFAKRALRFLKSCFFASKAIF